MLDILVDTLELSNRTKNCLKRNNIFYLSQLMELDFETMASYRNMGNKSLDEVLLLQSKIKKEYGEDIIFTKLKEAECGEVQKNAFVFIVFPQCVGKDTYHIVPNEHGLLIENESIEELPLSIRSKNALIKAGYKYLLDLMEEDVAVINNIHSLGAKSIAEIIDFVRDNYTIEVDNQYDSIIINYYNQINNYYFSDSSEFNIDIISKPIKKNLSNCKELLINKESDEYVKSKELLNNVILKDNVYETIEEYVFKEIQKVNDWIELSIITSKIPDIFEDDKIEEHINKLVIEDVIEKNEHGKYRVKILYLSEWIDELQGNNKEVIKLRIQNKTLNEIGEKIGVTRERARQLIVKNIKRKPHLREDDYSYWYEKYLLDKEAMQSIFEVEDNVFYYLTMVYKAGKKPYQEIINDENITKTIYMNAQKYENRNKVKIGDKYIISDRNIICKELAKRLCVDGDIKMSELLDQYMQLLIENGLEKNSKLLFSSLHTFEARIVDNPYILYKYGKKIRYYPVLECDIMDLVSKMHFEQFKDVEISTLKLFNEYPDLMNEYDIRDEYELHNLLKKTYDVWSSDIDNKVEMNRMPFMAFGEANREKQTIELLFAVAPVSLEEFLQYYEIEYGVQPNTVQANFFRYVEKYYHNGTLSVDQPTLSQVEKEKLSKYLNRDFFFIEDVKKIFLDNFGDEELEKVNPRTLKEMGFKVYTNYIIKDKYASAYDYFKSILISKDVLDLKELDARMTYVQVFTGTLEELRSKYILIEYEDLKFINYDRLVAVYPNINKEIITEYVEEAINYSGENEFFTVTELINDGFDSPLHKIGLEEWFGIGLIKNSRKVRFVKTGGNVIFSKRKSKIVTLDFIEYILQRLKKINIYDFENYLKAKYGLDIPKEKIIQYIKNSDIYYDSLMEKIYINKNYYYDEI